MEALLAMRRRSIVVASASRFLDVALKKAGPLSLCYVNAELKLVIGKHILDLVEDHPTLTPRADPFTYDDGSTAYLLNISGVLPLKPLVWGSPFPAEVFVAIWLHPRYPVDPPSVIVSLPPAAAVYATAQAPLAVAHPFVDPSTGVVKTPYLLRWGDPSASSSVPNLSQLASNLIKIFSYWPPFNFVISPPPEARTSSLASPREATDLLAMALLLDLSILTAAVEEDRRGLVAARTRLRDRAAASDLIISISNKELDQLRQDVQRVNASINDHEEWLKHLDKSRFPEHAPEGVFLPDGDEWSWKLEDRSGFDAIDDLIHALGKAAEKKVIPGMTYLQQVRELAREQATFIQREAASTLFPEGRS